MTDDVLQCNVTGPYATALLLWAYSKETDDLHGNNNTGWPHRSY